MAKTVYVRYNGGRMIHVQKVILRKNSWGGDYEEIDTLCSSGSYYLLAPVQKKHLDTHTLCKDCFKKRKFNPDLVPGKDEDEEPYFRVLQTGIVHYSFEKNAENAICGVFYPGYEASDFLIKVLGETGFSLEDCKGCVQRISQRRQTRMQRTFRRMTESDGDARIRHMV